MNEQTSGQLRQLLQVVGTLMTTLGVLKPGMADMWIPVIMQVVGPLMMLYGVFWSWKVNRPQELVASVVAMAADPASPVKGVVVTQTVAGRELAADSRAIAGTDTTTIAAAGTVDAKAMAVATTPPPPQQAASSGGL